MDATELFKSLVNMGLAGFIFWFYRQDRQDNEVKLKGYSDMLIVLVRDTTTANTGLSAAIEGLRQDLRDARKA
jgi:hypothetical protein